MSLNSKDMGLIALTVSVGAPVYLCIHVSWAVVHSSLLNVCKCDLKKKPHTFLFSDVMVGVRRHAILHQYQIIDGCPLHAFFKALPNTVFLCFSIHIRREQR